MRSIKINSITNDDGILNLNLPLGIQNAELEVMVIVQPIQKNRLWDQNFFKSTYGVFKDNPLERPKQNEQEERLEFE